MRRPASSRAWLRNLDTIRQASPQLVLHLQYAAMPMDQRGCTEPFFQRHHAYAECAQLCHCIKWPSACTAHGLLDQHLHDNKIQGGEMMLTVK